MTCQTKTGDVERSFEVTVPSPHAHFMIDERDSASIPFATSDVEPRCRFCALVADQFQGEPLVKSCNCVDGCYAHVSCIATCETDACTICGTKLANHEFLTRVGATRVRLAVHRVALGIWLAAVFVASVLFGAYLVKLCVWLVRGADATQFGFCWGAMCVGATPAAGDLVVGGFACGASWLVVSFCRVSFAVLLDWHRRRWTTAGPSPVTDVEPITLADYDFSV